MYTLLIVDDEPNILEGVSRMLDWKGYGVARIETASTCSEALARAVDCKPDIGLVDVRLGKEYGYDLISRINDLGLRTNYVMMSGYGEFQFACEAIRCGALDYLLKPIRTDKLQACVEKIIVERLQGTLPATKEKTNAVDPVLHIPYDLLPSLTRKILLMVRAEYAGNITLKSIAGQFRMNATYLGQIFTQETRLKFSEYLMIYRLTVARECLINTDDKISTIAQEVGYSNLNYFYQHFHTYFNITPSEMRAEHQK